MSILNNVIALLLPIAAAAVADKVVLYRHKHWLHDRAVKYWCRLDDTPVPDILRVAATWIVNRGNRLASNRVKSTFFYLMASVCFLCIAYGFNTYLSGGNWKMGANGDIFDILPFPHILVLATVVAFDMATLILTRRLLEHLQSSTPLLTLIGIISHLVVLVFLLILCLASARQVESRLVNGNAIGERGNQRLMAEMDLLSLRSMSKTNTLLSRIVASNMVLQVNMLLAEDPKMLMLKKPKIFMAAIRFNMGSTVYSHIDNSYFYDFYQSVNAFFYWLMGTLEIGLTAKRLTYWKIIKQNLFGGTTIR